MIGRLYVPSAPDGFLREILYGEPILVIGRAGHPVFAEAVPRLAALSRDYLATISAHGLMGRGTV